MASCLSDESGWQPTLRTTCTDAECETYSRDGGEWLINGSRSGSTGSRLVMNWRWRSNCWLHGTRKWRLWSCTWLSCRRRSESKYWQGRNWQRHTSKVSIRAWVRWIKRRGHWLKIRWSRRSRWLWLRRYSTSPNKIHNWLRFWLNKTWHWLRASNSFDFILIAVD